MRVVIKNADFHVYGLKDISELLSEVQAKFGGIGSDINVVESLFRSLGADGSNDIWPKIKNLYLPVLGLSTDGDNALYDVIEKTNYPGSNYVIEEKRGVSPRTLGGTIGSKATNANITTSGASFFFICTQSSRQTLGSSSAQMCAFYGMDIIWEKTQLKVNGGNTTTLSIPNRAAFSAPGYIVVSAEENGTRHCAARGETLNGTLSVKVATDILSGYGSWAATSLLACCEGLTSAECGVIATALDTFITDFGILCVN